MKFCKKYYGIELKYLLLLSSVAFVGLGFIGYNLQLEAQSLEDDILYCSTHLYARYCACGTTPDFGSNPKSILASTTEASRTRDFNEVWTNGSHVFKCWFTDVRTKLYCPGGVGGIGTAENRYDDPYYCLDYTEPEEPTEPQSAEVDPYTIAGVFGFLILLVIGAALYTKKFNNG